MQVSMLDFRKDMTLLIERALKAHEPLVLTKNNRPFFLVIDHDKAAELGIVAAAPDAEAV